MQSIQSSNGGIQLKNLILIRHGETEWNTKGRFQGKTDTPLSEKGLMQATILAEKLKNTEIDIIYSSPLSRAYETARPLAAMRSLEIITRNELKEIDFGRWEGLTIGEIEENYPEEFKKCRKDPFKHGFRFGLSYDDVRRDVSLFLDECIHIVENGSIAIVAHSVVLKMCIIVIMGFPPEFFHSMHLDNCSVSQIGIGKERNVILKLNDTCSVASEYGVTMLR